MDGLTAARTIAGERLAAVLILTAFSQHDLVEQARDAGALALPRQAVPEERPHPRDRDVARPVRADRHAREREREPRRAARSPQDHRPGQGPADGRARHERSRSRGASSRRRRWTPAARSTRSRATSSTAPSRPDALQAALPRIRRPVVVVGDTYHATDGETAAARRPLARVPGVLRAALPTSRRRPARSRTRCTASRRCSRRCSRDEKPDHIAVAFDAPGGSTFRNEIDADYKAGRKETPDLFAFAAAADPRGARHARDHGSSRSPGVEADDVIATLATRAAADGHRRRRRHRRPRLVPARARPAHQGPLQQARRLRLRALRRSRHRRALPGVTPAQYPDYAALRGDTSDNLPGVPGIGEKTAAKLITTYDDLEGIFEHLDDLPPEAAAEPRRVPRPGVQEPGDVAPRPRRRLRRRARRPAPGAFDARQGARAVQPARVPHAAAAPARGARRRSTSVPRGRRARGRRSSPRATRRRAEPRRCSRSRRATRTRSNARWAGVSGRSRGRRARDRDRRRGGHLHRRPTCSPTPAVREGARGAARRRRSAARRAPRQGADARAATLDVCESLDLDTAVMAYLARPGRGEVRPRRSRARATCRLRAARRPTQVEGTLDLDGDAGVDDDRPPGRASLLRSATRSREALRRARARRAVRARSSDRSSRVLARDGGTPASRIDRRVPRRAAPELQKQCDELEPKIHAHAGEPFNVNSTPQLRRILFEKLGLTPVKRTKTGPSTDADSLQKMAATRSTRSSPTS